MAKRKQGLTEQNHTSCYICTCLYSALIFYFYRDTNFGLRPTKKGVSSFLMLEQEIIIFMHGVLDSSVIICSMLH